MKRLLLIMCIAMSSTLAGLSPPTGEFYVLSAPSINPYEDIWIATCMVESQGNAMLYNVKENAVGIVQIRQVMLDQYNHETHNRLTLKQMYEIERSKSVFMHFAQQFSHTDIEKISRHWNGGKRGIEKQTTIPYYNKIKQTLAFIRN